MRRLINLPDAQRFDALVAEVFASGRLTNNGAVARELERRLAEYLDVRYLVLTSSGTLALQIAYRALGLTGEVITTPFSWVTTASSLCWVGLTPKFVDIDPRSINIDARRIEDALTDKTSAILPVHTFGNPSNIDAIESIAARHGLRTIYDGAHAFGTLFKGRSVLSFGDACVLSLHATKLFHTVEGGAVVFRHEADYRRAVLAVNNGMGATGDVHGLGINGRLSELHAAVGLSLFDDVEAVLRGRRRMGETLRAQLQQSSAVELQHLNSAAQVNHAYFPVVFPTEERSQQAADALAQSGFAARRYFDPTLNRLPFIADQVVMPLAESLSKRVLCLPLPAEASLEQATAMGRIVAAACPIGTKSSPVSTR